MREGEPSRAPGFGIWDRPVDRRDDEKQQFSRGMRFFRVESRKRMRAHTGAADRLASGRGYVKQRLHKPAEFGSQNCST